MNTPPVPPETYLGDAVYAAFDGWCIWLMTERENGWHSIALEPEMLAILNAYAERLTARAAGEIQGDAE